ncbi:hypothetical protein W02_27630 [Nitrospira sp. KM1]|uniref:hypothetical protein n=1 Tax=Nitrospira sp. KM1 TaxID=1936990 RepID=UPI0013A7715E|nr:hypothetical protein [Nitrospira sp. KM1]BCA55623.1 hypothetical protein W02_27630 [Nitrospira sp. KM1]
MTPNEAAEAVLHELPSRLSPSGLEEYGIHATPEQAQVIWQEILSLNFFWITMAVEAHIPKECRVLVKQLVLNSIEQSWPADEVKTVPAWNQYSIEQQERTHRYERLANEGMSPLAISAELGMMLEEQRIVEEESRRNVLTLLIDSVPVDAYGEVLKDLG